MAEHLEPCHEHSIARLPEDVGDRSIEPGPSACEARCKSTPGCGYFNFWPPDGGCALAPENAATIVPYYGVISGPAMCKATGDQPRNSSRKKWYAMDLWMIDGQYYDFRPLMSWHPGTKLPLMKTKGKDVSVLIRVQHLSDRPLKALQKYAVDSSLVLDETKPLEYRYSFEPDGFYMTAKDRVQKHLAKLGVKKPRQANNAILTKIGVNMLLWAGSWYRIAVSPFCAYTCLLNMCSRMVLTGQAHEAMHMNVLPQYPVVERMFSRFVIDGILCTPIDSWWKEHVVYHHPHTKSNLDPDENLKQAIPVWRLTNATPWNPMHAYPLASTAVVGSIFPYLRGLTGHIPRTLFDSFPDVRREGAIALASLILLHWLPLFVQKGKRKALLAVFLSSMLASYLTLVAFHVNHLFGAADAMRNAESETNVDWGVQQMLTTSNFYVGFGISGGLDLQIEHHLFPMLSYHIQQEVQPIIQQTAKEFGVPYHSYSSLTSGIIHHLSYMVELGSKPDDATLEIHREEV